MAEVEAVNESEAIAVLTAYIGQLEGAILLASEERRPGGDSGYAARVLKVFEDRIRASMDAAASEAAHRTVH